MLNRDHLVTIQAALQFWADEMCPHGAEAMGTYLYPVGTVAHDADQVQQLSMALEPNRIRYVRWDPVQQCLHDSELLEALPDNQDTLAMYATIILPTDDGS